MPTHSKIVLQPPASSPLPFSILLFLPSFRMVVLWLVVEGFVVSSLGNLSVALSIVSIYDRTLRLPPSAEDLIVRLAFKVPLVAPGRATTVEFAFFLLRLLLPPSVSPFASVSPYLSLSFSLFCQPFAGSRVLSRGIPSLPFAVHPPIIPNTENTVAALLLLLGYSRLLLFPFRFSFVTRCRRTSKTLNLGKTTCGD